MNNSKSIFSYLDYRVFLKDEIERHKQYSPGISYRGIAYKIGCNPGFFIRVLNGERNLSDEHALKLGEILKLGRRERKYFELLVHYNQAKKHVEQEHFFEQLEVYRSMNIAQVSQRQYAIYSQWYYMVLRELLHFFEVKSGCDDAVKALSRTVVPGISQSQVRDALKVLEELGMIAVDSHKRFVLNEQFITSGMDVPAVVINRFLTQFMELARQSIDRFSRSDRSLSTLTFSVSQKGYEKIRHKLDDYRKELLSIVGNENKEEIDRVYHLNMHLFPVTEIVKRG